MMIYIWLMAHQYSFIFFFSTWEKSRETHSEHQWAWAERLQTTEKGTNGLWGFLTSCSEARGDHTGQNVCFQDYCGPTVTWEAHYSQKHQGDGVSCKVLTPPSNLKLPHSPGENPQGILVHALKYTQSQADKPTKQTSHTQFKPEKHLHLAVKWAGDFSSCSEQKASVIHRWLNELQGIHMAMEKEGWHTLRHMLYHTLDLYRLSHKVQRRKGPPGGKYSAVGVWRRNNTAKQIDSLY